MKATSPGTSAGPGSCASCGMHQCHFNVEDRFAGVELERTAWLLDERWEEFETWLNGCHAAKPTVLLPWRGRAYAWNFPASFETRSVPWLMVQRSLAMRRLGPQGARRQQVLESLDQRLAAAYAARLPDTVTKLVVWQNFLPFLHLDKTLGGREYDVLLWRAPRHVLHQTLEEARGRYPESATLHDYRSSGRVLEAERAALLGARRIITAHTQLARLYPEKTTLLDWCAPSVAMKAGVGKRIAFLGPTIGRRGAYMVREAMRKLDLPLLVLGKNLEEPSFWRGLKVEMRPLGSEALHDVGLLLAPAITEFKPRQLLKALGQGIEVIAAEACGLPAQTRLHFVAPYDAEALAGKIGSLKLD